jgi:membrane protease YdiL (CAAX protease family)
MSDTEIMAADDRPLFRRTIEFPLVAMIIAVLLFALASALAIAIGKFVGVGRQATPIVQGGIIVVLVVAAYKLAIVRLGEHPRDDLRGHGAVSELGLGIAGGFALFGIVVGIAAVLGAYRIAGKGDASQLLFGLVTAGIVPAITEEVLFRGILFRWIEAFGGSWAALVVTSALFGLVHIFNPNATWFSSFAIALEAGLLLGGAYMVTRSLWLPIGLHAGWNFTQGAIFGVPVSGIAVHGLVKAELSGPVLLSGGQFGLEASVIGLLVAAGAGVWLVWLALRRGELVRPWWVTRGRRRPGSLEG